MALQITHKNALNKIWLSGFALKTGINVGIFFSYNGSACVWFYVAEQTWLFYLSCAVNQSSD